MRSIQSWNPQHADHRDRVEIQEAWINIQNKLSIQTSVSDLKRKRESLMSTYRLLRKKVLNSENSGADIDDIYTPSWFAFKTMHAFLWSTGNSNPTIKTEGAESNPVTENESDEEDCETTEVAELLAEVSTDREKEDGTINTKGSIKINLSMKHEKK